MERLLFFVCVVAAGFVADASAAARKPPRTGGAQAPIVVPDPVSDRVGATAGTFRVDESGAATYAIPLPGVPGAAGLAPVLSLAYSSHGDDGPLGKGWSIGGTSRIVRCRATREAGDFIVAGVATDGVSVPIAFDASDRLCLDGQRLLPAPAGSPACRNIAGTSAVQLRTELESFRRVCAYTAAGASHGPSFITVERPDGTMAWHGDRDHAGAANRPDGYVESTTPAHEAAAIAWAQTRVQDTSGNYIDWFYIENPEGPGEGEHLLREVRYTGKLAQTGDAFVAPPFASFEFRYERLPVADWQRRFVAGGAVVQTRRLASIVACAQATAPCAAAEQVRAYRLAYAPTPSGSGAATLQHIEECRDESGSVCLAPTRFEWSAARLAFEATPAWHPTGFGSAMKFEGFKLGDIDGDGRPDLVWLKDGAPGESCPTEHVMVSFGERDAAGRQGFAPGVFTGCTSNEVSGLGENAWQLFDYTGDGRDDLFVAGTGRWRLHPSQGRGAAPIDTTHDLLASTFIPQLATATSGVHPQLTDLNGDGLLDVVYSHNGLRARLMSRNGATWAWGHERSVAFKSMPALPCPESASGGKCLQLAPRAWHADGLRLLDFDGDAASDLVLAIGQSWQEAEPCLEHDRAQRIIHGPCGTRASRDVLFAHRVSAVSPTTITLARSGAALLEDRGRAERVLAGDVNADGLTDLVYESGSPGAWRLALNTGRGFLEPLAIGTLPRPASVRLVDVDGDGRSDLVFVDVRPDGTFRFRMRRALPGGGFGHDADLPGNGAYACIGQPCDPDRYAHAFADLDADGAADYFALHMAEQPVFVVAQPGAASRGRARDAIVEVRNGLGARIRIEYALLSNAGVHRRSTASRDHMQGGRGSPIADIGGAMAVVARVGSSAPQMDAPDAMATVHYRYAGARVQAGGRGFLGFAEVESVDANSQDATISVATRYHQAFPLTGHPASTQTRLRSAGFDPGPCLGDPGANPCFMPGTRDAAWPASGRRIANATQTWATSTKAAGPGAAFAPGAQAPVHVRATLSEDTQHDSGNGTALRRIRTTQVHGAHGNIVESRVETYPGAGTKPMASQVTRATFADDPARWLLGRVQASTVTHARPGVPDVVRTVVHRYDAAGLLIGETTQPGADLALTRVDARDARGNVVATHACGGGAACGDGAFHPEDPFAVSRTSRTVFDAAGRFPVASRAMFHGGDGRAVERDVQRVLARDAMGAPTHTVDVSGTNTVAVHGVFGRPWYAWVASVPGAAPGARAHGAETFTTYRWCTSGADRVACPTGASYRRRVANAGAPTTWSYFDVLDRIVLEAAQALGEAGDGPAVSGSCTGYDTKGRATLVSAPFFLPTSIDAMDAASIGAVCMLSQRAWARTAFDALGHPLRTTQPDGADTRVARTGATTRTTDPLGRVTTEMRNALGEIHAIVDAAGHLMTLGHAADGALLQVVRDAGRGPVVHAFEYDAQRRKRKQVDPDSGTTLFDYNAVGELVAQTDAVGNRIEHHRDGQGRVHRKRVVAADGALESEATFVFDTAAHGVGLLHQARIGGTYLGWRQQAGMQLDFVRTISYDGLGRAVEQRIDVDGTTYTSAVAYDALGRAWKRRDASGRWDKTRFDAAGFAVAACASDAADVDARCARPYRHIVAADALGRVTREILGTLQAVRVSREHDSLSGRLQRMCVTAAGAECALLDDAFAWDLAGNLVSRTRPGFTETFVHDALDRLVEAHATGPGVDAHQRFTYDALGNLCRLDVAGVARDAHFAGRAGCGLGALPGSGRDDSQGASQALRIGDDAYVFDARGNLVERRPAHGSALPERRMRFSLDDRAHEIALGPQGAPTQRTRLWYGPDGQRYKQDEGGSVVVSIDGVDIEHVGAQRVFRRRVAPGVVLESSDAGELERVLLHDHLGSVARVLDREGGIVAARDWFAFGEPRRVDAPGTRDTRPFDAQAPHGFTGHAHLGMPHPAQVVHANGRLYDPWDARFLQPDPFVVAPGSAQGWHPYAYANNAPLAWTDPTGLWGQREQDALRGAIAIGLSLWTGGVAGGALLAGNVGTAFTVAMAGGFAAGMVASNGAWRAGVAGAFGAGLTVGIGVAGISGAPAWTTQAIGGGVVEVLQGGSFGHGFATAGISGALMPHVARIDHIAVRGVTGALLGGAISEATGGRFANGAIAAGLQAALSGVPTTYADVPSEDARMLAFARDSYAPAHADLLETIAHDNGFSLSVYRDGEGVVAAMRGSEGGMLRGADWWGTNYPQAVGLRAGQYRSAMHAARHVHAKYGDGVVFTGHSLGGGLASVAALATGRQAVTFNAAGVHPATLSRLGLRNTGSASALVRSYRSGSDILSLFQAATPFPDALGRPAWIAPAGRHGIPGLCRGVTGSGC